MKAALKKLPFVIFFYYHPQLLSQVVVGIIHLTVNKFAKPTTHANGKIMLAQNAVQ